MILEVGPKVKGFKKGDRVAYCGVLGAYCQERLMRHRAARAGAQGRERRAGRGHHAEGHDHGIPGRPHCAKAWLKKGDIVLFHAAAGGVGLLFGQWAKARGYKVIGTVSSPEKAALAKKNGYKWVIDYTKEERRRGGEEDHQGQGRAGRCSTASARTPGMPRSTACSRAA